jgi:D-arabinose 5-phosphate isomerase GutQ
MSYNSVKIAVDNHEKSTFASLAKAGLDLESKEDSDLVVVRHTICPLSRQLSYLWAVYEHSAQSALQNTDCRPKKMIMKKNKKTVKEKTEYEETF